MLHKELHICSGGRMVKQDKSSDAHGESLLFVLILGAVLYEKSYRPGSFADCRVSGQSGPRESVKAG